MVNHLRAYSGLVLFTYVVGHLINHAFGLVSIRLMNRATAWLIDPWETSVGTVLLCGALLIHVGIALRSLYLRRSLAMSWWEAAQLSLGLLIPLILAPHVVGTRVAAETLRTIPDYYSILVPFWLVDPWSGVVQAVGLVVVWVHACIGLHYWLRLTSIYPRVAPILLGLAVALPVLALSGYVSAGMAVLAEAAKADWWAELILEDGNFTPEVLATIAWQSDATRAGVVAVVLAVLAARRLRAWVSAHRRLPRLFYIDANKQTQIVAVPPGAAALEAIRSAGIAHAAVCGGRGRCSTCRVRVGQGLDALPPAAAEEQRVLDRICAPAGVRLACQMLPIADVYLTPLVPPTASPRESDRLPDYLHGVERELAILFADLRGFTRMADGKLPYDVVFVLNQYFAATGLAVEQTGGRLDKFIGDGVMALFGINQTAGTACHQALCASVAMGAQLDRLNRALVGELHEPLRIGIGIHVGPVILGEMGYGPAKSVTAIGDAVNTASRLEAMTKEHGVQLIVSDQVARKGGVDLSAFAVQDVAVRGKRDSLTVRLIPDVALLSGVMRVEADPSGVTAGPRWPQPSPA